MPLPGTIVLLELQTQIASAGYSQYLLKDHLVLTGFQEVASILCVHCHSSGLTETVYEYEMGQLRKYVVLSGPLRSLTEEISCALLLYRRQNVTHAEQLLHNMPTILNLMLILVLQEYSCSKHSSYQY